MIKEHTLFSRTDVFPILTESQSKRPITCMWFKVTVFSEKVSPLLASQNFTRVFCLSGNDGKRPDHKIQQIPANLRIHDCRNNIMFNRSFYSSLRSRRLEVVGARKNERARGRQGERERLPGRPTPESSPTPNLADSRYVICQKFWQKTSDLEQRKRAAKKRGTFYCFKDSQSFIFSARHQLDTWTHARQETRGMAWFCGCWEF